jgi:hypothetical protein
MYYENKMCELLFNLLHVIPTRYTIHRVYFYLTLLYMFRALLSPIVRSTLWIVYLVGIICNRILIWCTDPRTLNLFSIINIQGDQKVSVHLTIVLQSSGVYWLFDHSVYDIAVTKKMETLLWRLSGSYCYTA